MSGDDGYFKNFKKASKKKIFKKIKVKKYIAGKNELPYCHLHHPSPWLPIMPILPISPSGTISFFFHKFHVDGRCVMKFFQFPWHFKFGEKSGGNLSCVSLLFLFRLPNRNRTESRVLRRLQTVKRFSPCRLLILSPNLLFLASSRLLLVTCRSIRKTAIYATLLRSPPRRLVVVRGLTVDIAGHLWVL